MSLFKKFQPDLQPECAATVATDATEGSDAPQVAEKGEFKAKRFVADPVRQWGDSLCTSTGDIADPSLSQPSSHPVATERTSNTAGSEALSRLSQLSPGFEGAELRKPVSEPAPDAARWQWDRYFVDQETIIVEDLRAEGTTLARVTREMRRRLPVKPKQRASGDEARVSRWARGGAAEFIPTPDTPTEPCSVCGDRVFHFHIRRGVWMCRTCTPPNALYRARWFFLRERKGSLHD